MTNDNEGPTFICIDCGAHVYDALGEPRRRCYPCAWVDAIVDDDERHRVRNWLIEVGSITIHTDKGNSNDNADR
jgi:hypothetical protein